MDRIERLDLTVPSGDTHCAAWLYQPPRELRPAPVVVLAHGFGLHRDMRTDAFAERFAQAGLAALVFDYRHFGASPGQPRRLLDIRRQREDLAAALAHARGRADVDASRIGLWGSSFGGGHVVHAAARDHDVRAVVAQVPFLDGLATALTFPLALVLRLSGAWLQDELARLARRPPRRVRIVGPPGTVAVMTTPDAQPGYLALVPSGSSWSNDVCARIVLPLALDRPGRAAARVRCPMLVCVAQDDAICPPGPALAAARRAPHGESRCYPGGHFDMYFGALFERVCADQVSFLRHHLRGRAPAASSTAGAAPAVAAVPTATPAAPAAAPSATGTASAAPAVPTAADEPRSSAAARP